MILFSFLGGKDGVGVRILCRLLSVSGHSNPITAKPIVKDKVPVQPMTVFGGMEVQLHSFIR